MVPNFLNVTGGVGIFLDVAKMPIRQNDPLRKFSVLHTVVDWTEELHQDHYISGSILAFMGARLFNTTGVGTLREKKWKDKPI